MVRELESQRESEWGPWIRVRDEREVQVDGYVDVIALADAIVNVIHEESKAADTQEEEFPSPVLIVGGALTNAEFF